MKEPSSCSCLHPILVLFLPMFMFLPFCHLPFPFPSFLSRLREKRERDREGSREKMREESILIKIKEIREGEELSCHF